MTITEPKQGRERAPRLPKHMREGSSGVNREDFADAAEYYLALHHAGGPGPNEEFSVDPATPSGAVTAAVYGRSPQEFRKFLEEEAKRQQVKRPNIFDLKL